MKNSAWNALIWTYSGLAAKFLCQLGIGVYIARILGPKPYGVVAVGAILISLGGLLADGGISSAIIKYQDASKREIAGAFWIQMGCSLCISVTVFILTPPFVSLINAPEAEIVLKVLTLIFPINAISSITRALHRRQFNMRPVQISMIISYLLAYGGVGIVLAIKGAGVWALVYAQLAQALSNAIILFFSARPPLISPVWPTRLLGFGGWTLLGNVTAWAHGNLMGIYLSKIFGPVYLGYYNRFSLITGLTVPMIGGPLKETVFPAIARESNTSDDYRRITRSTFRLVGLIFFPSMAIMFFFPQKIIIGMFGSSFISESQILSPLALAAVGEIWIAIVTQILSGHGKVRAQWFSQFLALPIVILILWSQSQISFLALCWGFCAGIYLRAALILIVALLANIFSIRDILVGFGPCLPVGLSGLFGAWLGFKQFMNVSDELSLFYAFSLAVTFWGLTVIVSWRWILPETMIVRLKLKKRSWSQMYYQ